jgi:hypothetical protein
MSNDCLDTPALALGKWPAFADANEISCLHGATFIMRHDPAPAPDVLVVLGMPDLPRKLDHH